MEFWQAIDLFAEGLAHVDEEHFDLEACPLQAVAEWSSGQANKSPHDDISQDMTTFLEPCLLGPGSNRAFEVGLSDASETCGNELVFDITNAEKIGAQGCHAVFQVAQKVAESVWTIARCIVAGRNVLELLDFDVTSRF